MQIEADRYRLRTDPERGTILSFGVDGPDGEIHLLRPAKDPDASPEPQLTGCFVAAPYFGRVIGGRFTFEGRNHHLDPTSHTSSEPIHGESWRATWRAVDHSADRVVLEHEYAPRAGGWPFAYKARQTFALGPDGLVLSLVVTNTGDTEMPCGLGVHPYFPKPPGTTVRAGTNGMWPFDPLSGAQSAATPPPELDFSQGQTMDTLVVDNCFEVDERVTVIDTPAWPGPLEMRAEAPFDRLQIFAPLGADFMCVEPVSHLPNGLCLMTEGRPGHGIRSLRPGESLGGDVCIRLRSR